VCSKPRKNNLWHSNFFSLAKKSAILFLPLEQGDKMSS
jgi:hypothetical protein